MKKLTISYPQRRAKDKIARCINIKLNDIDALVADSQFMADKLRDRWRLLTSEAMTGELNAAAI